MQVATTESSRRDCVSVISWQWTLQRCNQFGLNTLTVALTVDRKRVVTCNGKLGREKGRLR